MVKLVLFFSLSRRLSSRRGKGLAHLLVAWIGKFMNNTTGNKRLRQWLAVSAILLSCAGVAATQEAGRKIIKKVAAQYPAVLRQRGIGGVVKLRVYINANGTVKNSTVLGGNAILADSAQKAVKQWIFAPGAEESDMEVSVVFDPNSQNE